MTPGCLCEIVDVIGGRQSRFVPRGDGPAAIDAALFQTALDRHRDATRLADHRNGPCSKALRPIVRHGHQARRGVQVAETVGPGNRQPGFRRARGATAPQLLRAEASSASSKPDVITVALRAPNRAASANAGSDGMRRNQHHQMIRRLRQFREIAIAARVPDRCRARD